MKPFLLSFLLASTAFAGGSSGVGNHRTIDAGIATIVSDSNLVTRKDDHVVDAVTGEKLIRVEHIAKSDLKSYGKNLVHSKMGQREGYEYLPNQQNIDKESNFWVICNGGPQCTRLVPVSKTNPKVQSVIGGLSR